MTSRLESPESPGPSPYPLSLDRQPGLLPGTACPGIAMKLKIRNSKAKKAKKTGFLTRQKTVGGRKINKRHRARHGSF